MKNYDFDFVFGPPWGSCSVTMTSVIGHLTSLDFDQQYRQWKSCRPAQLFDAPVVEEVASVRISSRSVSFILLTDFRIKKLLPTTSQNKLVTQERFLYGPTVIAKESISVQR